MNREQLIYRLSLVKRILAVLSVLLVSALVSHADVYATRGHSSETTHQPTQTHHGQETRPNDNNTQAITLTAHLADHTLGAATVELHYDATEITLTGCTADPTGRFDLALCNDAYAGGVARFSVVSSTGVSGQVPLARIDYTTTTALATPPTVHAVTFVDQAGLPLPTAIVTSVIPYVMYMPLIQN